MGLAGSGGTGMNPASSRSASIRVVMTLLVRNEADIIRRNIDYHRSQGVDHFLVMDHGSDDGTVEILQHYHRQGFLDILYQQDPGYYQAIWVTEMARCAARDLGADWVINSDADEFWWPIAGDLRSTLASVPPEVDVLYVQRHNFLPTTLQHSSFQDRMIYRQRQSTNSLGQPLPGKACHRADPFVTVEQGNHDCFSEGFGLKTTTVALEILHFPVRGLEQIIRKISAGGRAYELSPNLPPQIGGTWRALYRTLHHEGLSGYYESLCLNSAADMTEEEGIILDTRLRDYMYALESLDYV